MNNKAHLRPKDFDSNGDIIPMACKEEKGDLISREALREAINTYDTFACLPDGKLCPFRDLEDSEMYVPYIHFDDVIKAIDNAPSVDIKDQIAGAYNEGYMCGSREAEKARLQGERVDISKLRLMTVEECAGHTIEYAMGWKACIEWIKKGGAE